MSLSLGLAYAPLMTTLATCRRRCSRSRTHRCFPLRPRRRPSPLLVPSTCTSMSYFKAYRAQNSLCYHTRCYLDTIDAYTCLSSVASRRFQMAAASLTYKVLREVSCTLAFTRNSLTYREGPLGMRTQAGYARLAGEEVT